MTTQVVKGTSGKRKLKTRSARYGQEIQNIMRKSCIRS